MIKPILGTLALVFFAVAFYLWQTEGVTVASATTGLVGALIGAIERWVDWLNPLLNQQQPDRQERMGHCRAALRQIKKDLKNFRSIAEDRVGKYSGQPHQDAVEVDSFVCVRREISLLTAYRKYRRLVDACVREIDNNKGKTRSEMDVVRLVKLISELESRLKKELGES
ncbi:MAG: hypothetical protein ACI8P0_002047 [Planctomycetaceae bacterium]|jgi:hypothetical protein